jgi:metallophosphoesterase (TIGR00282 family)
VKRLLFIGDIVGEVGLAHLEAVLPHLKATLRPDFIVANAENLALTGSQTRTGCGMTPELVARLFGAGVDLVTGGNHSWDGPASARVHEEARVLRPLNYGTAAPGRGAAIVDREGFQLGVINLVGRSTLPLADDPLAVIEVQLAGWSEVDAVLVDFHSESVTEKLALAYALAGRVTAVLGTHTHVPTTDLRLLPGGTAYVSDVGMTGPSGGIQGYAPEPFVQALRTRLPSDQPVSFATGPIEFGAVYVDVKGRFATAIARVEAPPPSRGT